MRGWDDFRTRCTRRGGPGRGRRALRWGEALRSCSVRFAQHVAERCGLRTEVARLVEDPVTIFGEVWAGKNRQPARVPNRLVDAPGPGQLQNPLGNDLGTGKHVQNPLAAKQRFRSLLVLRVLQLEQ